MGTTKIYMIVTNDKNELPIKCDLIGAKEVADYLGVSVSYVRDHLHTGKWQGKYKVEAYDKVKVDKISRHREYCKRYSMTHDRSVYFKERYKKNGKCTTVRRKHDIRQIRFGRTDKHI